MKHEYLFHDRRDAGRQLGNSLKALGVSNPYLLALPRGGVVVGDEVAKILETRLSVVIARKIGEPFNREFGIGALSEDLMPHFNEQLRGYYNFHSDQVAEIILEEQEELKRRVELYRNSVSIPALKGKTVIVIDDGLATGVTAFAAGRFLRTRNPSRLVLAVPVGPSVISSSIRDTYDEVVCLYRLSNLQGVGLWYEDFEQVEDDEVLNILQRYGAHEGPSLSM